MEIVNEKNSCCIKSGKVVIDDVYKTSVYDCGKEKVYGFRKKGDLWEDRNGRLVELNLGNMCSGYDFELLDGLRVWSSECGYIMGCFSDGSEEGLRLEELLRDEQNGYMGKKKIRMKNIDKVRKDWNEWNIEWMKFVVWRKCLGNVEFRELLKSLPEDVVLVEDSTYQSGYGAYVWGCKNLEVKKIKNEVRKEMKKKYGEVYCKSEVKRMIEEEMKKYRGVGRFEGRNVMGKILMGCKMSLDLGLELDIDYELLRSKKVNILGKVLDFNEPKSC